MATYYIDPQGAAGNGTSPADSRTTIPGYTNSDTLLFKRGSTYSFTGQLSITATGTVWADYGTGELPIFTSTATNFGSINVSTASGVTTFRNIQFLNYLSGSGNGAVINCAAPSVRVSSIAVDGCWFNNCAYNAIKINGTNTATAALTFECIDSTFTRIGEDCVFGCALDFRFGRNDLSGMSWNTATGDGVGMINGDPEFVWIYSNRIDHSGVDIKQCVIIDTSGAATGQAIIEDNTFIGYGTTATAPTAHVVLICDMPAKIRRNVFYTYGLTCGTNHASDEITGNVFNIGNADANNVCVAIQATGSKVNNNTFIGIGTPPATLKTVTMASGVTSASVRNNIFVNVPIAVKSDSVGNNPTATNNCFYGVTSQRLDSSNAAFSGGNDVTSDPALRTDYMPMSSAVRTAGTTLGGADYYGKEFPGTPTIGAVQYQTAKTNATRTVTTRTAATRSVATKRVATA